jgi:hypothetical protein
MLTCLESLTSEVIEVELDEAGQKMVRLRIISDGGS